MYRMFIGGHELALDVCQWVDSETTAHRLLQICRELAPPRREGLVAITHQVTLFAHEPDSKEGPDDLNVLEIGVSPLGLYIAQSKWPCHVGEDFIQASFVPAHAERPDDLVPLLRLGLNDMSCGIDLLEAYRRGANPLWPEGTWHPIEQEVGRLVRAGVELAHDAVRRHARGSLVETLRPQLEVAPGIIRQIVPRYFPTKPLLQTGEAVRGGWLAEIAGRGHLFHMSNKRTRFTFFLTAAGELDEHWEDWVDNSTLFRPFDEHDEPELAKRAEQARTKVYRDSLKTAEAFEQRRRADDIGGAQSSAEPPRTLPERLALVSDNGVAR